MPSSRTTRTGTHYAAARSTQGPPTQAMHHNSPSSGCVMMGITSFIDAAFPPTQPPPAPSSLPRFLPSPPYLQRCCQQAGGYHCRCDAVSAYAAVKLEREQVHEVPTRGRHDTCQQEKQPPGAARQLEGLVR